MTGSLQIGVLGAGAWATTLANHLASNHHSVLQWCHKPEYEVNINQNHKNFLLPGIVLHENLKASLHLEEVLGQKSLLVAAVASPYLQSLLDAVKTQINQPVLSVIKGLHSQDQWFASEVLRAAWNPSKLAVLSGPNLALEIAQGKPSATVIASENLEYAQWLQQMFNSSSFRVYTSSDRKGVELGGIIKNVMALAGGICDGLNLGLNAKAALMNRAVYEMRKIAVFFKTDPDTVLGLSGLGDLMATCFSENSRNWKAGYQLGQGVSVNQLRQGSSVCEGIRTVSWIAPVLANQALDLPIIQTVYDIVVNQFSVHDAIQKLMTRALKSE